MSYDLCLKEREKNKLTKELFEKAILDVKKENPNLTIERGKLVPEMLNYNILLQGDYKCNTVYLSDKEEGNSITIDGSSENIYYIDFITLSLAKKLEPYAYIFEYVNGEEIPISRLDVQVKDYEITSKEGKLDENKTLQAKNYDMFTKKLLYLGVMAIKSSDSDKILEYTNNYYYTNELKIVEERIGNRTGIYATSPKHYADLSQYEKTRDAYIQKNLSFCTDFSFCNNFKEISDWNMFLYYPQLAEFTTNIDNKLAKYLSRQLQTVVIEYYRKHPTGDTLIRKHENGELIDIFWCRENKAIECMGYFAKFSPGTIKNEGKISEISFEYFRNLNLDMYNNEIYNLTNIESRHPMYLKGSPENIIKYLKPLKSFLVSGAYIKESPKFDIKNIYDKILPLGIIGDISFDEFKTKIIELEQGSDIDMNKLDIDTIMNDIALISEENKRSFEVDWKWDAENIIGLSAQLIDPKIKVSDENTTKETFKTEDYSQGDSRRDVIGSWGGQEINLKDVEFPSELINEINKIMDRLGYPWIYVEYNTFGDSYGFMLIKREDYNQFCQLSFAKS